MAKRNVHCVKPSDPPFLRKMKEQCGFTKDTIETKKQLLQADADAHEDQDDELPQVVVLKSGDLTQEEAERIQGKNPQNEDERPADPGAGSKIYFGTKRSSARSSDDTTSNKTRKKLHGDPKKKSDVKAVKNKSLLSFDEGEEDC
ncbi:uncharacterized protein KIAA1143 homolog [Galendromus occidentalis]|uniref:Uncharacterized protein KIAA1143 homolog n=1 Tax=Galendromus occidentalis TaxID=34638 RepID=A0AAJ6QVR4_9ACAR|nr:uncharacterized protein KIAA1143 homolog [Galendromus occidentalis]